MSIKYKDVLRLVRFKENDNDEVKFSDYEIKMAFNEVVRYLSNALALTNSDFNEKFKVYCEKDYNKDLPLEEQIHFKFHGVDLPEDFLSLVAVKTHCHELLTPCISSKIPNHCEYKVVNNKIFCGVGHFILEYKGALSEIKEDDDEVELPYMFLDNFVQLVRMILNQAEADIMLDAVNNYVQQLIPRRRYRNAKIKMPFNNWRW